ncbi:MAG: hypothetical protein ACXW0Q_03010 [Methylovulum sp.]
MQKYFNTRQYLPIIFLPLLLTGCASEPTAATPAQMLSGEQMLRESQGMAHLGDRWKNGKLMADRGNNLIREGQMKIDEGNRMVEEGTKVMRESEESYKNIKN